MEKKGVGTLKETVVIFWLRPVDEEGVPWVKFSYKYPKFQFWHAV